MLYQVIKCSLRLFKRKFIISYISVKKRLTLKCTLHFTFDHCGGQTDYGQLRLFAGKVLYCRKDN